MATQFKHSYEEFSAEAIKKRVQQMLEFRDQVDVETAHVKFSYNNRKTGALVPSVSLIPVADCGNCKVCAHGCYDVRNVCFQKNVQKSRANNSAIFHKRPLQYMMEIKERAKFLRFFRWHIGGDIVNGIYLTWMCKIAEAVPTCEFLAFTKMYDVCNEHLAKFKEFPKNLHIIFSDWKGAEFKNPYNLPVSSPVWPDGRRGPHAYVDPCRTTYCPGDCGACAEVGAGCWGLKKGEVVLFEAH